MIRHAHEARATIDWVRVGIVALDPRSPRSRPTSSLNLRFHASCRLVFPLIGVGRLGRHLWPRFRLATARLGRVLPETFKGTIFLLALVTRASMMPVETCPPRRGRSRSASASSPSVFDNIPLTALALKQGGYDWGFLALRRRVRRLDDLVRIVGRRRAVEPVSRRRGRVGAWLRHGWHVAVAYVVGFFVMLAVVGWRPDL